MSYLDHIRRCNRHDLAGFLPFYVAEQRVGWVRRPLARRLAEVEPVFTLRPNRLSLRPGLADFAARTAAMASVIDRLVGEGLIPRLRGEYYPVLTGWGTEPLLKIDRSAVAYFGVAAYGVHVNGIVRGDDGQLSMWIGRRARDRLIEPGKFDNMIAGGQPIGLSLSENLIKEAWEEAGVDADLAARARPVGAISYLMETAAGLKPDTLFLYDLDLDPAFVPDNTDGEVEIFELWPIEQVAAAVRSTDDFKFNVGLVIIDFLIRHGYLTPQEPDYLDLVRGLRA